MDNSLMQAIVEVLGSSLSPDPGHRQAAEERLDALLAQGETGLALVTLLSNQSYDLTLRQMSSIDCRASSLGSFAKPYTPQTFKGSPPSTEVKLRIRETLYATLSDPTRKIRASAGYALSTIAQSDWPDECPDMLQTLLTILSSGTPDGVDGAMRVFAEFTKSELSEEQLLPILRQLLPVLINILGAPDNYTALTRSRVLAVFTQCIDVLYMVKDQHKDAVKEATDVILPQWLLALKVLLELDPLQDVAPHVQYWDNLVLRTNVFKVLERVTYCFPRAISTTLPTFLACSVTHLDGLLPTYLRSQSGDISPPGTSEDASEPNILPQLASSIMDFAVNASRTKSAKAWLSDEGTAMLAALVESTIRWTQMTAEDEEEWAADANAFVADENEEDKATLRSVGFDLISSILDACPAPTAASLNGLMQKITQESRVAKDSGRADWWKPLEAVLAAVGSVADDLTECNENEEDAGRTPPFDVKPLLVDLIPPLLSLGDQPFLQGRGFVFSSQFSGLLPANLFSQYLNAAVEALEASSVSMPVKVSAVKAIQNFSSQSGAKDVIVPLAPRIASDLTPFLPDATEESLTLLVEALLSVIDLDGSSWLTPDFAVPIVAALMNVWIKNVKDPILLSVLTDVFVAIAKSPAYPTVVSHTLPALAQAISSPNTEDWVISSAIDLISSLIRGAAKGGLGDGFFAVLGPALFGCLGGTRDREVIQNGIECLTLVIRKGSDQLISFVHPTTGETGLALLLKLTATLLTPTTTESEAGGLFIGDMLVHLLKNAAGTSQELRAVLPELCTALVRRMESARTATFMQSLIIPIAYLVHTQKDDILALLESTHMTSSNALDVLCKAWCENAETFQGAWATKISTIALCELFTTSRPSLDAIVVKGDMIIKPETSNVIMTRSRTKKIPTEYAQVPLRVRILKIIIHELQHTGDNNGALQSAGEDDLDLEGDDEEGEWQEEEDLFQGLKNEEMGFLSQYLESAATGKDGGMNAEEEEDLKDDPITQVDLRNHLLAFLRQCASADRDGFSGVVGELNAEEVLVMKRVLGA